MDPLFTVGSLTQIVRLTGQLARGIIEVCEIYIDHGSDSSEEIALLHHEVISLKLGLEEFGDLSHVSSTTVLPISRALAREIANCPSGLTALKEKIDPGRKPDAKSETGFGGLQWPLTRDELVRAIKDIERYRTLLRWALQAERLKRWSTVPREIIEWAGSPLERCIFLLKGLPGTGKSTIFRKVAEHLQIQGMLGASFFVEDCPKDRRNATRLFSTIAKQLAANVPLLTPGISQAVAVDPDISTKSPKLQFDRLLLQPILSLDQDSRTTTKVLVIDGLDECTQDDVQTILHLLPQLQRSTCVPISIFFTSRPDSTICQGFRDLTGYHDIDLHGVRAANTHLQILVKRMRPLLDRKPNFEQDAPRPEVSDDASCPPSDFSKPSLLSTAVSGNSLLTQTEMESAIDELVSIFFEDQNMNLLYQVAVGDRRIGPERFARNFRRLLKLFSDDLKNEALVSFDMELANLVQSKAGLVANTIRDRIKLIYDDPSDLSTTDVSEKPIQDLEKDRCPDHTSTEDMDITDDTDSDGDEVAERAHERFAVLVSRGRGFIEESNAFKKLRKDLEKFVFPALEEVPKVKPESANEHQPAPSDPIGISPPRSERKYYLTLQRFLSRIGLQESSIPPHHRRLRWTNRRGERLYDDYVEHEPGALQILQDYLDTSVERTKTTSEDGQGQTFAGPTSQMSIPSSTWVHNTGTTNIAGETQLPEGTRTSLDQKDVELGEDSSRTLRLMSCIERRGHQVTLHQEVVSHIKDDRELFHALRCIYHNHKGRFESFWSLRTIHAIHFMKFTYGGHPYIDVRCHNEICEKGKPCNCIPPPRLVPPMGAEYECCPVPPKLSPPIGPQLMMSLFNDPDSIQSGAALIMQQLPKRLNGKLCSSSFEQEEAWGIYYEEGWNWAKIWLFLAIGFFLPSLVFGILWGVLKRDVQGAFGIASWWMTGATIFLGVIGTCS